MSKEKEEYNRLMAEAKAEYDQWLEDCQISKTYWTKTATEIDVGDFLNQHNTRPRSID